MAHASNIRPRCNVKKNGVQCGMHSGHWGAHVFGPRKKKVAKKRIR